MTDRLHLPQRYRRILEALLREHVPNAEVWAYGSCVTGENHDGCDLDLVVRGPELKPLGDGFFQLVEAIEKSNIPILVQAHDWARLPESFHAEIEREYVVLVEGMKDTTRGEWREVAIGDLVEIKHGFAFKGTSIRNEPNGDILLTPGNFAIGGGFKRDKFKYFDGPVPEEYVLQEGDLLVTMTDLSKQSDTLGYPALVPPRTQGRRYLHNQRLGKISPKAPGEICARYIYYVMCSGEYRHEVIASATGTTVKHTSPDRIKRFRFSLPPLLEQRTIAHILGTLDDKMELNRRMNETLEEMARALFKSWFVDFDPVRAKAALKTPPAEASDWTVERARAYLDRMDKSVVDLFPDRLVDSELGEIPEGWEVKALGNLIEIHDNRRIPLNGRQRANRTGPYPYYGAAGIMSFIDNFIFDGIYVLTGEDGTVIDKDDRPVVQYIWGQFWVNNHAHVLRGKNGISEEHLYLLLQQMNISSFVTGAVQPKLSQRNLKAIPIVFPGRSLCRVFSDLIRALFARLRKNADETKLLAEQRKALLPKLVSREVRLHDVRNYTKDRY